MSAITKYVIKKNDRYIDAGKSHDHFDKLKKGSIIPVTINNGTIIVAASTKIYKERSAAFRELFANACRSAKDAEQLGIVDQAIVNTSISDKLWMIMDNGTGIGFDRFKEVFSEIGTSDNLDSTKPGQFGIGILSFLLIADSIIFETWFDGKNGPERFAVEISKDLEFKYLGMGSRKTHGTTVKLIPRKNIYWNTIREINHMVANCGIKATLKCGWDSKSISVEKMNAAEILERITKTTPMLTIDCDDYEFAGVLEPLTKSNLRITQLASMPIKLDPYIPFDSWILNIKNERKYRPVTSRAELKQESEERIIKIVTDEIEKRITEMMPKRRFRITPDYKKLCERKDLDKILYSITNNTKNAPLNSKVLHEDLFERCSMKYSLLALARHMNDMVAFSTKTRQNMKELESKLDTNIVTPCSYWFGDNDPTKIAAEWGITKIARVARDCGVLLGKKTPKKNDEMLTGLGTNTDKFSITSPPEGTVMAAPKLATKMRSIVKGCDVPYIFVRYEKSLAGHSNVVMFDDFIKKLGESKISTNMGPLPISKISKDAYWTVASYGVQDLVSEQNGQEWIQHFPRIIILDSDDEELIMLYSTYFGERRTAERIHVSVRNSKDWDYSI